jgi:hypothetical protein
MCLPAPTWTGFSIIRPQPTSGREILPEGQDRNENSDEADDGLKRGRDPGSPPSPDPERKEQYGEF